MRRLFLFTTVIACLCLSTVNATAMTVDKGLVPYQVIQCNNEGRGSVSLAGTSGAARITPLRNSGCMLTRRPRRSVSVAASQKP